MMFEKHYDIVIIGAGPAGLIAGIESFKPSRKILILEKMPRPALKLRISGKGLFLLMLTFSRIESAVAIQTFMSEGA